MIDAAIIVVEAIVKSQAVKPISTEEYSGNPEDLMEFIDLLGKLLAEEYCRELNRDSADPSATDQTE